MSQPVPEPSPCEERIGELLNQMTLEEKVGQLTQFSSFYDVTGPTPAGDREGQKHELLQRGIVGSMLNVVGYDQVHALQKSAVENSRFGIPMLFAYDVIHGHKTMFPIPLAEAASWDLDLIEKSARIAAIEASAQGLNWTFAPMIDITRDARWGRVMEGAGEDPYLGSVIGEARVKGFQGEDLSADNTIAATAKHFAGYGFAEAGKEYNTVEIGTVTLFNTILQPFRDVLKNAKPRSVMNAFNTINGIPATGDEELQRKLLKGEWSFDGVVVSDWGSGLEMIEHGFVANARDAAHVAMTAGSDVDMESHVYLDHLQELVETGEVEEALVDDAVHRVLKLKWELGLFDDPFRYLDQDRERDRLMTESHLEAALEMARNSIVLLKNKDNILPLKYGQRIGVIGALAADKDAPLGNWRAHAEPHSAVSVLEGLEQAGIQFTFEKGVEVQFGDAGFEYPVVVNEHDRSGMEDAVETARNVDTVIMVLGETARQSGEGRSRTRIDLPGLQQELVEAVQAVNPNIILIVMSGRPLDLSWADKHLPAIIQAWHLGHRSGHAIVDVLTGKVNPSGKLPMSFPRNVGQLPIYYNHLNTGRPGPRDQVVWSHYSDEDNSPLYPFGYGLSYAAFEYSNFGVELLESQIRCTVSVKNAGAVAGKEVIQLYIRDRVASVARPVKELKAFAKIEIQPGQVQQVSLSLAAKGLGFYNGKGEFRLEPGEFELFIGGSSVAVLTQSIDLTADQITNLLKDL